ncbi:hypothetical protein G6F57_020859 [Rhizopus arrhizus]|nr:hypothetical protein G6F57_020859 [Rhizopus arrhizus]
MALYSAERVVDAEFIFFDTALRVQRDLTQRARIGDLLQDGLRLLGRVDELRIGRSRAQRTAHIGAELGAVGNADIQRVERHRGDSTQCETACGEQHEQRQAGAAQQPGLAGGVRLLPGEVHA